MLSLALLGGDEAFLGGHVGVEGYAGAGALNCAAENAFVHQADLQIGAVGSLVVQLGKTKIVQIFAAMCEVGVMFIPCRYRILVNAGHTYKVLQREHKKIL